MQWVYDNGGRAKFENPNWSYQDQPSGPAWMQAFLDADDPGPVVSVHLVWSDVKDIGPVAQLEGL